MQIDILTLFPEFFCCLDTSLLGKAQQKGLLQIVRHNIRDFSDDKHKKCDDYTFGGGAGMLMTPQPIHDAICAVDPHHRAKRIYLSPKGRLFEQKMAKDLANCPNILLLCGHYEGIDQRVIDMDIDLELSVGDFVLTGGESAAIVVIDALSRFVDGVLGSEHSVEEESFSDGLLEYPQYTRPQIFLGQSVPALLLNGNHAEIAKWRREKSLEITAANRPEMYQKYIESHPQKEQKTKRKTSKTNSNKETT